MVDTGKTEDLNRVVLASEKEAWRNNVKIAFAGSVSKDELETIIMMGADIVDVGRSIIDAPIMDFKLDVVEKK
jgi:nicotinate-nucleotide pyrophosphorylase (carboxylating)